MDQVALPFPSVVVFDCDGVILQSNKLKSDAFATVLEAEAHDATLIAEFVAWHQATGGVSRFHKFAHFYRDTLDIADWQARTKTACDEFGEVVSAGLRKCELVPGVKEVFEQLRAQGIPMLVNTGGAQDEIRAVFAARGLDVYFEEVLGSPETKQANMVSLVQAGLLGQSGIYFGDSALDFELAEEFSLDFVFVNHESEWSEGREVTSANGGTVIQDFTELTFS